MALAFKDQTIASKLAPTKVFTRSPVPRAVTPHRQGVGGVDAAALGQGLQHGFDEAVAGVAGGTFAVGAEVGQLAAAVPDGNRRADAQVFGAGQGGQGFDRAQAGR